MTTSEIAEVAVPKRRMGRSVLALGAGFVVNIALSLATDVGLQAVAVLPVLGQAPMNDFQAGIAAAYRVIYCVLSSYVVARLAPNRPMGHALVGAGIGMLIATAGAVATWNKGLGPHWYPVLLVILALPTGYLGGRLRLMKMRECGEPGKDQRAR